MGNLDEMILNTELVNHGHRHTHTHTYIHTHTHTPTKFKHTDKKDKKGSVVNVDK